MLTCKFHPLIRLRGERLYVGNEKVINFRLNKEIVLPKIVFMMCNKKPILKKKISEIKCASYGVGELSCEPTKEEIEEAIKNENLEKRNFQDDLDELNAEWNLKSNNFEEYITFQKDYNARRIAYFIVNGWSSPILLDEDGVTIKDGLHRFKAAKYLENEMIDVVVF